MSEGMQLQRVLQEIMGPRVIERNRLTEELMECLYVHEKQFYTWLRPLKGE